MEKTGKVVEAAQGADLGEDDDLFVVSYEEYLRIEEWEREREREEWEVCWGGG
jgi:hypothetical protein